MPSLAELFAMPDVDRLVSGTVRLVMAAVFGGLLGADRESVGKAAGLRTHMLVAVGAALFMLSVTDNAVHGDEGRVIQGIAAGIGFIGAGTILKRSNENEVTGLTTAASIWLTAAIGVASAVGTIWLAGTATLIAWLILNLLARVEPELRGRKP